MELRAALGVSSGADGASQRCRRGKSQSLQGAANSPPAPGDGRQRGAATKPSQHPPLSLAPPSLLRDRSLKK